MDVLIQKLHPALRPGQRLTLARSGLPLFSRQGDWDAGSALHCVAMAFALLDKLSSPAAPDAAFWERACAHYLHGLTLSELVSFVWELNLGARPVPSPDESMKTLHFCEKELARGWPVIVSLRRRNPSLYHTALAVGIEGLQRGRTFVPHALLLLDPAGPEPGPAACNARLEFGKTGHCSSVTAAATHRVAIDGAVSIRSLADTHG